MLARPHGGTASAWLVVLALVAVGVVAVLWSTGWWKGPPPRIDPAHEERAAERERAVEAKDQAIRGLATEITRLRALADREGRARAAAEQQANAFAERAKQLNEQLGRIEAERRMLARATSVQQVREALARRGIIAK